VSARPNREARHWLLRRRTRLLLWLLFGALLGLVLLAGRWVHPHAVFGFEDHLGFFALYGFAVCVALVVVAKVLGIFLKRAEDYYQRPDQSPGSGNEPQRTRDGASAGAVKDEPRCEPDTRPGGPS